MRDYLVIYKDGKSENVNFPDKKTLVKFLFKGDHEAFLDKVKLLRWTTHSMQYEEDVQSGKTKAELSTADANPYGWRIHSEVGLKKNKNE